MPITQTTSDRIQANIERDLFAKDANLDLRGFMVPHKNHDDNVDPFLEGANLDTHGAGVASAALKRFLQTREAQEELAKFSPQIASDLLDHDSELVALEFVRRNPSYYRTENNYDLIVNWLAKKYLRKDYLPTAEAQEELMRSGSFTSQTLTDAFEYLTRAGLLEMSPGHVKQLSREEEDSVIANLRIHGADAAISRFMEYSLGGEFSEYDYRGVDDFLSRNAELASRAAIFVWHHLRNVASVEFTEFHKTLRGRRMLTVHNLDELYAAFEKTRARSALFDEVPVEVKEPTRQSLDEMSDSDVDTLLKQSLREHARKSLSQRRKDR